VYARDPGIVGPEFTAYLATTIDVIRKAITEFQCFHIDNLLSAERSAGRQADQRRQGLRLTRVRGVPLAGEALGFGELCAHRFTQGEITRPIQLR